jgi:hypothetical protein
MEPWPGVNLFMTIAIYLSSVTYNLNREMDWAFISQLPLPMDETSPNVVFNKSNVLRWNK